MVLNILFQGTTPQEKDMQDWMKSLLHKMNSSKTERNVKIFIAKLIVNVEEVRYLIITAKIKCIYFHEPGFLIFVVENGKLQTCVLFFA